jgi:soluble lytic murein transglycosylase-like protein
MNLVRPLNVQVNQAKETTEIKLVSIAGEKKRHLASSFSVASKLSGLSVEFLISLSSTESNFNERAVSSKGYKGLMQIPHAVYYPDANIIIGAHIFNEKMKIAKGNLKKAICLYKGYDYDTEYGRNKAEMVIALYRRLLALEV